MDLTIRRRDQLFGYFLTIPGLATLIIIIIFPISFTILTSFFDYTLITPNHDVFVGFENYYEVIEEDYISDSVVTTAQFVFLTVFIELIVGFSIAVIISFFLTKIYILSQQFQNFLTNIIQLLAQRCLFLNHE